MNEPQGACKLLTACNTNYLDTITEGIIANHEQTRRASLNWDALPSFMKRYVDTAARYTDADPGALLTAWLPVIAVNIGNHVYIPNGSKRVFPNVWAVLIGPSTVSRKTTCIRLALKTIDPYEANVHKLFPDQPEDHRLVLNSATKARLGQLLAASSNRLLAYSEIKELFQSCSATYNSGQKAALTSLFDGDSITRSTMERTDRIDNPALSIVGASTEGWLYNDYQSEAERASGFPQRFLYCIIKPDGKPIDTTYRAGAANYDDISMWDNMFRTFRNIPGNHMLGMSKDAITIWQNACNIMLNDKLAQGNDALMSYLSRIMNDYFFKFAILITLMENHDIIQGAVADNMCGEQFEDMFVTAETARQSLHLCQYYYAHAKPFLDMMDTSDNWERERKIVKYLSTCKNRSASRTEIYRTFRFKRSIMNECLQSLLDQEVAVCSAGLRPAPKPAVHYTLNESANKIYNL